MIHAIKPHLTRQNYKMYGPFVEKACLRTQAYTPPRQPPYNRNYYLQILVAAGNSTNLGYLSFLSFPSMSGRGLFHWKTVSSLRACLPPSHCCLQQSTRSGIPQTNILAQIKSLPRVYKCEVLARWSAIKYLFKSKSNSLRHSKQLPSCCGVQ